jgi:hypothetical protein
MSYGLQKGSEWQMMWILVVLLKVFIDVAITPFFESLVLDFGLPSLIKRDMLLVIHALLVSSKRIVNDKKCFHLNQFSSTDYVHASSLLAREMPDLLEAKIVLMYRDTLPDRLVQGRAIRLETEKQRAGRSIMHSAILSVVTTLLYVSSLDESIQHVLVYFIPGTFFVLFGFLLMAITPFAFIVLVLGSVFVIIVGPAISSSISRALFPNFCASSAGHDLSKTNEHNRVLPLTSMDFSKGDEHETEGVLKPRGEDMRPATGTVPLEGSVSRHTWWQKSSRDDIVSDDSDDPDSHECLLAHLKAVEGRDRETSTINATVDTESAAIESSDDSTEDPAKTSALSGTEKVRNGHASSDVKVCSGRVVRHSVVTKVDKIEQDFIGATASNVVSLDVQHSAAQMALQMRLAKRGMERAQNVGDSRPAALGASEANSVLGDVQQCGSVNILEAPDSSIAQLNESMQPEFVFDVKSTKVSERLVTRESMTTASVTTSHGLQKTRAEVNSEATEEDKNKDVSVEPDDDDDVDTDDTSSSNSDGSSSSSASNVDDSELVRAADNRTAVILSNVLHLLKKQKKEPVTAASAASLWLTKARSSLTEERESGSVPYSVVAPSVVIDKLESGCEFDANPASEADCDRIASSVAVVPQTATTGNDIYCDAHDSSGSDSWNDSESDGDEDILDDEL